MRVFCYEQSFHRPVNYFISRYRSNLTNKSTTIMKNIKGIIFDMDGTLTVPVLNFQELRRRLDIKDNSDILEFVQNIQDKNRQKDCQKIIEDFEDEGNEKLTLQPNIFKIFEFLHNKSLPRALITRNNSKCVDSFSKRFLSHEENKLFKHEKDMFSIILSRDFKPVKPHPASALHVCNTWGVEPSDVLFVGDDVQDMQCGKSAGTWTALKLKGTNDDLRPLADVCINDLSELISVLNE